MSINWSLLGPALQANPGEAFTRGLETGVTRSALGALTQNPSDTRAMSALAAFNPQAAMQMQEYGQTQRARQSALEAGRLAQSGDMAGAQRVMYGAGNFEGAGDLARSAAAAADARSKQQDAARDVAQRFTGFAQYVRGLPADQRAGVIAQARPDLLAMGVPEDRLTGFDPSDANLDAAIASGMSAVERSQMDNQGQFTIEGTRFNSEGRPIVSVPLYKPVEDIGLVEVPVQAPVYPGQQGAPQTTPAPQQGGTLVTVNTPEEAAALAPGTEFRTPDGRTLRVPGGPASSAPGGFPDTGNTYTDPAALRAWNGSR